LTYEIEVKHIPSIPNNIKHLQVFSDDQELKIFLETIDEFSTISTDQENENDEIKMKSNIPFQNKVEGNKIMDLKTNHIPKGLVPLEKLFDSNYVLEKYSIQSQEHDVFNCNIGIVVDPKIIKLSKALSEKKKRKYVKLMRCLLIFFLGHMNTLIFFTLT
jgi:hypothetical protein